MCKKNWDLDYSIDNLNNMNKKIYNNNKKINKKITIKRLKKKQT